MDRGDKEVNDGKLSIKHACAALFVAFLHRKLVLFSDNLCQTIDDMLNGAAAPQVCEEENLFYKINHRLVRLMELCGKIRRA